MVTLAVVFAVLATLLAALTASSAIAERVRARAILRRLDGYRFASPADEVLLDDLGTRLIRPLLARVSAFARRWSPAGYTERSRYRIVLAGNPADYDLDRHLALKVLGCAAPIVWFPIMWTGLGLRGAVGGALVLTLSVAGFVAPDRHLDAMIARRQAEVARTLPDFIDLLVIAVEAGLGFDQAVERASRALAGPLSDEFQRMLQEVRIGATRAEALRAVEERTQVPELRSFVLAMLQADTFGVSVARVLRHQAEDIRVRRQLAAKERAQKTPVKMLFPLVLCIFPGLFIVILGPALISITRNL